MTSTRFLVAVGLLAGLGVTAPQTALPGPEGAPSVRLEPLRGDAIVGRLLAVGPVAVVVETAALRREVPIGQVRSIAFPLAGTGVLAEEAHLRVVLTTGETVVGRLAGARADGLVLDVPGLGQLSLLLDVVRSIVPVPARAGPCHEPEQRHPPGEEDVAYVASGDTYAGILIGVTDEGLTLETERGQTRQVAWSNLVVLHLQNPKPPARPGLRVEVETIDGTRLVAEGGVGIEDGHLVVARLSRPDPPVRLPTEQVRVLRFQGGDFVYASDLPFESEFVPYYRDDPQTTEFLERWFAARVDRRPSGCPLRLGGTTYRHGFAVHAKSSIRIRLDRVYASFEVLFGVDDEARGVEAGGVVDARILGDEQVLWEAREVRAGAAPRKVGPLDVSAVGQLVLEVDFGAELHVRDRATWADPILVRR